MKNLSLRTINAFLVGITILASLIAILYFQKHLGLEPCPLCIFQRIGLWIMGAFALLAVLINPKKLITRLVLWLGAVLGVLWGGGVAARHVWLQHLPPDQVPACGPGLNYWVDTLPILQVFQEVLKGSGECAEIDWQMFGFSIPELTLVLFVFLGLVLLLALKKIIKKEP
ncbi:MAG: disulfide bond formation protein B [Moraxella sp.]|nr:disulfide bond formation protein B [Moraxella sp.]